MDVPCQLVSTTSNTSERGGRGRGRSSSSTKEFMIYATALPSDALACDRKRSTALMESGDLIAAVIYHSEVRLERRRDRERRCRKT